MKYNNQAHLDNLVRMQQRVENQIRFIIALVVVIFIIVATNYAWQLLIPQAAVFYGMAFILALLAIFFPK